MRFVRLRGSFFLFLASLFWGTTFVAQSVGMNEIGPYTYGAARYSIAVPVVWLVWLALRERRASERAKGAYHPGWKSGLGAGVIMLVATSLQQIGIQYTTVGKASFITGLYLVLVPLTAFFFGSRIRPAHWLGAFLALAGLYFLCMKDGFSLAEGDFLIFLSTFFWTAHILYIDRFAAFVDAIELSVAQLFVCACGSALLMLLFEEPTLAGVGAAWASILYAGILSSGIAFTLQVLGQQYAEPALAAVIMSLEAVIGVLAGMIILGEVMGTAEILGCALMLAGMLFAQCAGLGRENGRTN